MCVCRKPVFLAPIKFLSSIFKWKIYKIRPTKTNKHNLFMLCIYVRLSVCLSLRSSIHSSVEFYFHLKMRKQKLTKTATIFLLLIHIRHHTHLPMASHNYPNPTQSTPKTLGPKAIILISLMDCFFFVLGVL